jgi:hypothetical protein
MIGLKIKCKLCGDVVQSQKPHRMEWCMCRACAVDGGRLTSRLIGRPEDYEVIKEEEDADSRT